MATFSEWLTEQRELRGWSQSEFAKAVGRPQQTVSAWEREARYPTAEACRDIAKGLGLPLKIVFTAAGLNLTDDVAVPDIPPWFSALVKDLDDFEFGVLAETARGLLRLRGQRLAGALPATPPSLSERPKRGRPRTGQAQR